MSFVWTVKMLGMQFAVLADAFALHYAHARSVSIFDPPERNKEMVRVTNGQPAADYVLVLICV